MVKRSKKIAYRNGKMTKTERVRRCRKNKIHKTMHEYKYGKLKTSHGAKVKNRFQAIAIALSQARRYCGSTKKDVEYARSRKSAMGRSRLHRKIHIGPMGGRFVIVHGSKRYL